MPSFAHHSKPVTISIVSHGQLEMMIPLLEQLEAACHAVIEKVILTFNIPEESEMVEKRWRFAVERINNIQPKGFGANHNQAFLRCETPWFLLLNPDIRLSADVIAPLIRQAGSHDGLLAPRIIEPGKELPESHRRTVTPLEIYRRKRSGYVPPDRPDWLPGLFMLFRSEVFRKIQGFDERFFMYGEDFDICARVQLAGWQLHVGEDLTAMHDAQRASHGSFKHFYWHASSLLKVWASSTFWRYRRAKPYRTPDGSDLSR